MPAAAPGETVLVRHRPDAQRDQRQGQGGRPHPPLLRLVRGDALADLPQLALARAEISASLEA